MQSQSFDGCTSLYRLGETTQGVPHLCLTSAETPSYPDWASFVNLRWTLEVLGVVCNPDPTLWQLYIPDDWPHLCRSFNESCVPWLFDWNCYSETTPENFSK